MAYYFISHMTGFPEKQILATETTVGPGRLMSRDGSKADSSPTFSENNHHSFSVFLGFWNKTEVQAAGSPCGWWISSSMRPLCRRCLDLTGVGECSIATQLMTCLPFLQICG